MSLLFIHEMMFAMKKFFKVLNENRKFYLGVFIVSFILSIIINDYFQKEIFSPLIFKLILLVLNNLLLAFIVIDDER